MPVRRPALPSSTRLDDEALDITVQAINATQRLRLVTVADLARVTTDELAAQGASQRDIAALRALIVAAGGRFADARPRGRPAGRETRGATLRVPLDRAQLARLDEVRGDRSREEVAAELLIAGLDRQ